MFPSRPDRRGVRASTPTVLPRANVDFVVDAKSGALIPSERNEQFVDDPTAKLTVAYCADMVVRPQYAGCGERVIWSLATMKTYVRGLTLISLDPSYGGDLFQLDQTIGLQTLEYAIKVLATM